MKIVLLALCTIFLDQWTKWLVMSKLSEGQSIPIIDNIFFITYVRNPGAAFGMLPYRTVFFVVVTVLVMAGIILFLGLIPKNRLALKSGLALQLGGAAGNFIDRLRFGHVIDFFDVRLLPVFNVADIAIMIGVGILVLQLLISDRPTSKASGKA